MQRLENLDIPTFPLINLWEGEDDQVPSLKATADELGFRTPIIGNLFRDGGEALAPQLDGSSTRCRTAPCGRTALAQGRGPDRERQVGGRDAYGVPAERVIYKPGFTESVSEAMELCQSAGISLDDLRSWRSSPRRP